jgi:hypothetical protein
LGLVDDRHHRQPPLQIDIVDQQLVEALTEARIRPIGHLRGVTVGLRVSIKEQQGAAVVGIPARRGR